MIILLSPLPTVWWLQVCVWPCPTFYLGPRDGTQVLMLEQEACFPTEPAAECPSTAFLDVLLAFWCLLWMIIRMPMFISILLGTFLSFMLCVSYHLSFFHYVVAGKSGSIAWYYNKRVLNVSEALDWAHSSMQRLTLSLCSAILHSLPPFHFCKKTTLLRSTFDLIRWA